jgi:hypothetical protein
MLRKIYSDKYGRQDSVYESVKRKLWRLKNWILFKQSFKVILHQFGVKKNFPWKVHLEYGGTLTKLLVHVSSQNMSTSDSQV